MSAFDGDNWAVWMWIVIGIIASELIFLAMRHNKHEYEFAIKAIESGMVQKIVRIEGEYSRIIWAPKDCESKIVLEK